MKSFLQKIANSFNYEVTRLNKEKRLPSDFEDRHSRIYEKISPFTMTSPERVFSLIEAVNYIEKNGIKGDIVECGVWKGGSMMAVAQTLIELNNVTRTLYLYDTFEGMPPPKDVDVTVHGEKADELLQADTDKEKNLKWAHSTLETVRENMGTTGYPVEKTKYIKGKVEDTIPGRIPSKIALLRLDTDWYDSTMHELKFLFPLLSRGGILIIDDYGYWQGARKAVDEYFASHDSPIYLSRIDETGRIAVKLDL